MNREEIKHELRLMVRECYQLMFWMGQELNQTDPAFKDKQAFLNSLDHRIKGLQDTGLLPDVQFHAMNPAPYKAEQLKGRDDV